MACLTGAGGLEMSQPLLGEVGAHQAGILRLDLLQVGLPDRETGEVQPPPVAAQQPQKVDHVPRSIPVWCRTSPPVSTATRS